MDSKKSIKWRIDGNTVDENGNIVNNIVLEPTNVTQEEMNSFLSDLKKLLAERFKVNEFKVIKHECPMVESPKDKIIELEKDSD
jgi:hypothetical protein